MDLVSIYEDLLEIEPIEIILPEVILPLNLNPSQKFERLYQKVQHAARFKNHHQTLYLAYTLGKYIEEETLSRSMKRLYKSQMISYYYQTSIRTYYLFEHFGIGQIFRTKTLSLPKICNLKSYEFKQLLTLNLAGAQS